MAAWALLSGFARIEVVNFADRYVVLDQGIDQGYVPGKRVCFDADGQPCGVVFVARRSWSMVYVEAAAIGSLEVGDGTMLRTPPSPIAQVIAKQGVRFVVINKGTGHGFKVRSPVCFYQRRRVACGVVYKANAQSARVVVETKDYPYIKAKDRAVIEWRRQIIFRSEEDNVAAIRRGSKDGISEGGQVCFSLPGQQRLCGRVIFLEEDTALLKLRRPREVLQETPPEEPAEISEPDGDVSDSHIEWRTKIGLEGRYFHEPPASPEEPKADFSQSIEPGFSYFANQDRRVISVDLFYRHDPIDEKRTHFDVREFSLVNSMEDFELRIGISKVFWGVVESYNLIDIVNQTDFVEDPDGEAKLGQVMVNISWLTDVGNFAFFALPFFRERTFPGEESRLANQPLVNFKDARIQAKDEKRETDYAFRYSHTMGPMDLGLSYFNGTNREPTYMPQYSAAGQVEEIRLYYSLIQQTSLDLQIVFDSLILKAEALNRQTAFEEFNAAVAGGEYTVYGIFGSTYDLGLFAEYLYDSRGPRADVMFQNDSFAGLKVFFNDSSNTQFHAGAIIDNENTSVVGKIEASRRMAESLELVFESQIYDSIELTDPVYPYDNDGFTKVGLNFFF
jgi:hypothetical protein